MSNTELLTKYKAMVEGSVWKASKKFKIRELDDLRQQAYLIFFETLENFDPKKASFSTFLFDRLRTVDDYAVYIIKRNAFENVDDYAEIVHDFTISNFENDMELLESALELSEDAQEIIDYLISREWETPGINWVPRLIATKKYFKYWRGWKAKRVEKAWIEIRNWWVGNNHFLKEC